MIFEILLLVLEMVLKQVFCAMVVVGIYMCISRRPLRVSSCKLICLVVKIDACPV